MPLTFLEEKQYKAQKKPNAPSPKFSHFKNSKGNNSITKHLISLALICFFADFFTYFQMVVFVFKILILSNQNHSAKTLFKKISLYI